MYINWLGFTFKKNVSATQQAVSLFKGVKHRDQKLKPFYNTHAASKSQEL